MGSLDHEQMRARFRRQIATDATSRLRQEEREKAYVVREAGAELPIGSRASSRSEGVDFLSIKNHLHGRLLDEIGSDRLVIVLDPANLFETADLPTQRRLVAEAVDLLAPDIAMAHAKDRTPDGSFATAGKGVLDYAHYIARLRASGFGGDLVAHGLSAEEAPEVARFLRGLLR